MIFQGTNINVWNEMFCDYCKYLKEVAEGLPLSYSDKKITQFKRWETTQRISYRNGKLSHKRENLLNSIHFDFTPKKMNVEKYVDLFHRQDTLTPEEKKIFNKATKYYGLNSKYNTMSEEDKKTFLSLSPDFFVHPNPDENWEKRYQLLKTVYSEKKAITTTQKERSTALVWASSQKKKYKDGKLTDEQIRKFKEINIDFKLKDIPKWEDSFEKYKIWLNEGNTKVLKSTMPTDLLVWTRNQGIKHKQGKLSLEKEKLILDFDPDFYSRFFQRVNKKRVPKEQIEKEE